MNAQQFAAFLKPQYLVAQLSLQTVGAASSSVAQKIVSSALALEATKLNANELSQVTTTSSMSNCLGYIVSKISILQRRIEIKKRIFRRYAIRQGLAERNIQTLKKRLAAMSDDPSPISKKFEGYRASPLQSGNHAVNRTWEDSFNVNFDVCNKN
uniref:Uncharacterized protein n=1 Tax=Glossina pallidipes TaxID=7398 RepID=A0A1A9ZVA2_GLOPL